MQQRAHGSDKRLLARTGTADADKMHKAPQLIADKWFKPSIFSMVQEGHSTSRCSSGELVSAMISRMVIMLKAFS